MFCLAVYNNAASKGTYTAILGNRLCIYIGGRIRCIVNYLCTSIQVLTLSGSRYVLVEFLPGDGYMRLFRAVRSLVQSSYLPVIAHAERYNCLKENGRTMELVRCGAYLQMNAGSLGGGLFDRRAAWCRKEILRGNIHFIATDMHGVVIRPPELGEAVRWMARQNRNGQDAGWMAKRLLRQNQEHILRDTVL